jgi:hypothetical protein
MPLHMENLQVNNTLMPEFIETILELEQQLGPFEVASWAFIRRNVFIKFLKKRT